MGFVILLSLCIFVLSALTFKETESYEDDRHPSTTFFLSLPPFFFFYCFVLRQGLVALTDLELTVQTYVAGLNYTDIPLRPCPTTPASHFDS